MCIGTKDNDDNEYGDEDDEMSPTDVSTFASISM